MPSATEFEFTPSNFRDPKLPHGLTVLDVPCEEATFDSLQGYGHLISSADERTVENGNFEIVAWPVAGWRSLDPHTGDEAGTTEGHFDVHWTGDYFFGHNLAIASENNFYLDGLGAPPEIASRTDPAASDGSYIHLWMSDCASRSALHRAHTRARAHTHMHTHVRAYAHAHARAYAHRS